MGAENFGNFGELLSEIKRARESIDARDKKTAERLDEVERGLNELALRHGRPGGEGGGGLGLERKSAIQMCVHRHDLAVPKRDRAEPEYEPSAAEVDEAITATKAFRSLLRHGDIERLPALERKSLTSFAFANTGWLMPAEISDRVLSCLVDQTNVASLMGQATISAGSVIFPLDNVNLDQSAAWACEANCFPNLPHPDLSGLGQLEIKAETIRALICADLP